MEFAEKENLELASIMLEGIGDTIAMCSTHEVTTSQLELLHESIRRVKELVDTAMMGKSA